MWVNPVFELIIVIACSTRIPGWYGHFFVFFWWLWLHQPGFTVLYYGPCPLQKGHRKKFRAKIGLGGFSEFIDGKNAAHSKTNNLWPNAQICLMHQYCTGIYKIISVLNRTPEQQFSWVTGWAVIKTRLYIFSNLFTKSLCLFNGFLKFLFYW